MTIKLLKFLKSIAENLENLHKKSVYDCYTDFRKSYFIRVTENNKVNDCITNIKNVNTCIFFTAL